MGILNELFSRPLVGRGSRRGDSPLPAAPAVPAAQDDYGRPLPPVGYAGPTDPEAELRALHEHKANEWDHMAHQIRSSLADEHAAGTPHDHPHVTAGRQLLAQAEGFAAERRRLARAKTPYAAATLPEPETYRRHMPRPRITATATQDDSGRPLPDPRNRNT